jgi:putative ABC transport system permease protein
LAATGNHARSVLGLVLGAFGSIALARLFTNAVSSLQSNSALAVGSVSALLFAVALLACWLPAWRATRLDPLTALREE